MTTEPVVSQEDREAAATIAALLVLKSAEVRGGQWDNHPVIKLLARHRLAALTEARAREEGLREQWDRLNSAIDRVLTALPSQMTEAAQKLEAEKLNMRRAIQGNVIHHPQGAYQ